MANVITAGFYQNIWLGDGTFSPKQVSEHANWDFKIEVYEDGTSRSITKAEAEEARTLAFFAACHSKSMFTHPIVWVALIVLLFLALPMYCAYHGGSK